MDNLRDHLLALEESLLHQEVRRDAKVLSGMLADDFREVGSSGRTYTKREIIDTLAAEAPREISLRDFVLQLLAPGVALVTYRSYSKAGEALRSSVWVDRGEGWRMVFHQGTRVPAPPDPDAVS